MYTDYKVQDRDTKVIVSSC